VAAHDARRKTGKFAPKELHRRLKRVSNTGSALKNLSGRERHKFRIKDQKADARRTSSKAFGVPTGEQVQP
jgi:hypothetical protein